MPAFKYGGNKLQKCAIHNQTYYNTILLLYDLLYITYGGMFTFWINLSNICLATCVQLTHQLQFSTLNCTKMTNNSKNRFGVAFGVTIKNPLFYNIL